MRSPIIFRSGAKQSKLSSKTQEPKVFFAACHPRISTAICRREGAMGGPMGPTNRHEFVEEMRSAQQLFEYFEKQFGEGAWVFERCELIRTTPRNPCRDSRC